MKRRVAAARKRKSAPRKPARRRSAARPAASGDAAVREIFSAVQPKDPAERKRLKVGWQAVAAARAAMSRREALPDPFALPPAPDWVPRAQTMATDSDLKYAQDSAVGVAWAAQVVSATFNEGLQFLGYPYLAQLAQRPEYRVISETWAEELTRKWLRFETVTREDDEVDGVPESPEPDPLTGEIPEQDLLGETDPEPEADKTQRIQELKDEFERLGIQEAFRRIAVQDGFFGRAHLYLDTGDTDNREELRTPIGDGQNGITEAKITKGGLKRVLPVEAVWVYPTTYDSVDPLKPDWYKPTHWFVMGKELHASRLLTFVGREVPDMLKPAYSFGGLSRSQMAKPYVDNWLQTRQSVNEIIHSFVVWGLKTNLSESLTPGGEELFQRLALFNIVRDNRGAFVIDKETEEFFNVQASLGSLDALQAQAQEHMASVSRIPIVKLLGIQPAGLNASSEGEIRTFYDSVAAYQNTFFTPNLRRVMHFVMMSLWGEVDHDITFAWEPLWSLDEKAEAELRKTQADTGAVLVEGGVISQAEERRRIATDPSSPYADINVNEMPDLLQEESEGLSPSGRVDPGLVEGEAERDETGEELPNEGKPEGDAEVGKSAVVPFAGDEANFEEGKHPRASNGQFGSGGGGSAHPESHEAKVSKALSAKSNGGLAERVELRKLMKEAKDNATREKLKGKVVESLLVQHDKQKSKGQADKAAETAYKLSQLGYKFPAPVTTPPPPAPANASPQFKAQVAQQTQVAQAAYTAEETASFQDIVALDGEHFAKECFNFAKSKIEKHGLPLTPGEGAHISAYTGNGYKTANQSLRAGVMNEKVWNHTKRLNESLDKLPAHVGTVRRGTTLSSAEQNLYVQGMVVLERAFTSASTGKGFGGNTLYEIKSKTGRDVKKLSMNASEDEILFKSGTAFKVVSVNKSGSGSGYNNNVHIVMEEV